MCKDKNNTFSLSTKFYIIKMVKRMKKSLCILILGVILWNPVLVSAEQRKVKLVKCVDGDTARFEVDGEEKRVRFLAVDTPESVHPKKKVEKYGKEASNYTCSRLTNAKKIILEYDDNSTKTDKYDRQLAWVFVDDELLQKDLVEKGYAKVAYLYGKYKYTDILKEEELKAKAKKVKIWADQVENVKEKDEIVEILKKIAKKILKKIENML